MIHVRNQFDKGPGREMTKPGARVSRGNLKKKDREMCYTCLFFVLLIYGFVRHLISSRHVNNHPRGRLEYKPVMCQLYAVLPDFSVRVFCR